MAAEGSTSEVDAKPRLRRHYDEGEPHARGASSLERTPEPTRSDAVEPRSFESRDDDAHHAKVDAGLIGHVGHVDMTDAGRSERLEEHIAILVDELVVSRR